MANAALGTVIFGKLSFQYLLLALALIKLLVQNKLSRKDLVFLLISTVLMLLAHFVQKLDIRNLLFSMSYILGLLVMDKGENSQRQFFQSVAITVTLIALHACITGGVEFIEVGPYGKESLRRGIIGVGIGDANMSCVLLGFGLCCIWNVAGWGKIWKIIASALILYAIALTMSISGLLLLLVLIVASTLFRQKKRKSVMALLLVAAVILLLVVVYLNLPADMHIEQVDAYILRVEEKLGLLESGNYADATTNRTAIASKYWTYFWEQSVFNVFFGGLKLNALGEVPHNTYLDMLLQTGVIGFLAIFGWIVAQIVQVWRNKKLEYRKTKLALKIMCLTVATNLSLYQGSLWALWLYFMVLL